MQSQVTRMHRVKAVAEMFDVSPSTIYRAIESGQLDALKIGRGKGAVRVPDEAVRAFIELCAEAVGPAVADESSVPLGAAEPSGEVA